MTNANQNFIKCNLDFLKNANIEIAIPTYSKFTVEDDKVSLQMSTIDQISSTNIEAVPHLKFISVFSILDYYVDTIYPNLIGKLYSEKYQFLKTTQQLHIEIIFTEIYRIAFFIRNCITHRPNQFICTESSISATGKTSPHSIKITNQGLKALYGLINLYISDEFKDTCYRLGLITNLYNDLRNGIINFDDKYESELAHFPDLVSLKENRNIILNPRYTESDNEITLTNLPPRDDYKATDIPILLDGKNYLIPREVLDNKNSIALIDIKNKWAYEHDHPILNTIFN